MPTEAHEILGLTSKPDNLLGWHLCVSRGLPAVALKNVAKLLGVTEKSVAELVLGSSALARKGDLERDASDFAYRFALAWTALLARPGMTPEKASQWLRATQPALKDRVPLLLLRTNQGQGYAMTAIERLA